MHVSRNKCELLTEYCMAGVKPEFDKHSNVTVKGIDITKIYSAYIYIYNKVSMTRALNEKFGFEPKVDVEFFKHTTQLFYLALNNEDLIDNQELIELTDKEMTLLNKYIEMEEFVYV